MSTDVRSSAQARKQAFKRAFRPFFIWLPIALFSLATHKLLFSVSVEGHPVHTGRLSSPSGVPSQNRLPLLSQSRTDGEVSYARAHERFPEPCMED
jgi:hypothetical protein